VIESGVLFLSVLLTLGAYGEYYRDAAAAKIAPNRWSWLIWSATAGMEVLTFQAVSGNIATSAVFIASIVACLAITLLIWRRAVWAAPTRMELICIGASILALAVWQIFKQEWWAHLVMLAAIPLSFLPTYRGAWIDYRREESVSWALWTIGDILALIYVLMRYESVKELPYAALEALAHAGVWALVWIRRRDHAGKKPLMVDASLTRAAKISM
jgi:hypothetical protein